MKKLSLLSCVLSIVMLITVIYTIITKQFQALPKELLFLFIFISVFALTLKICFIDNNRILRTKPVKSNKIFITADKITLEEAEKIYFKSNHSSCDSTYDFVSYLTSAFEKILKSIPSYTIEYSTEKVKRQSLLYYPVEKYKSVTSRSDIRKIRKFVVIDTETTGLKPAENDIIELCAIKFEDFLPVEKFHTYLKPRKFIPEEATAINNITDDMVSDSPRFSEIKTSFEMFLDGCPLVAHNASFDLKFLYASGLDLNPYKDIIYDTLSLSRKYIRDYNDEKLENYKLATVCDNNNIYCEGYHSADADTLACGILFVDIIKTIKDVDSVNELLV